MVEVAARDVVAGDWLVADGLVHVGGGEAVPVLGGDPRVEHLVAGPQGQDHGLTLGARRLEDQLGEDAVGFADGAALADPGQVPVPDLRRYPDGAQAGNHGLSLAWVAAATSGTGLLSPPGTGTPRNQRHKARSSPDLMLPASRNGRPSAIDWAAPAR